MTATNSIHPATRIGHVHLKVADIDRALDFYCGVLGFEITQRMGADAAFIAADAFDQLVKADAVRYGKLLTN